MAIVDELTDHAILRYLQAKYAVDLEAMAEEILTPELQAAIAVGATSYTKDGMTYVIANGRVVTIKDGERPPVNHVAPKRKRKRAKKTPQSVKRLRRYG